MPRVARMLGVAWEYAWSSATAHTGRGDAAGILAMAQWTDTMPNDEWEHRLKLPEDDELLRTIRKRTHSGRPLANDAFLSKLKRNSGDACARCPSAVSAGGRGRAVKW